MLYMVGRKQRVQEEGAFSREGLLSQASSLPPGLMMKSCLWAHLLGRRRHSPAADSRCVRKLFF